MGESVRDKAVEGMAWTTIERVFNYGIQFVVGIVIARLISPSDYGLIGMLAIFIAISQTFLDSGFASALIQKKKKTEEDYSTVFWFNIVISIILYLSFYASAPLIAYFYNQPELKEVARVVSLCLIINGLTIVQTAKLSSELNFKLQSIATISAVVVSGCLGLFMAYNGYGVWALVAQTLSSAFVRMLVVWARSLWYPKLVFSFESFKSLFSFGSKILCSSLINTIYQNLYTMVIGKSFQATAVGYYNRGDEFAKAPGTIMTQVLLKVNYPVLSKFQDDNVQLVKTYKKLLHTPLFILYPLLFGIMVLAEPMVQVLLGDKWLSCVPIMQILIFGYIWSPLTHVNLNLLYVKGRSDLVLRLELIKKPIAFLILFVSIPYGIWWMCVGRALYFFVAFVINCYYTGKLLDYGVKAQISELLSIFGGCIVMSLAVSASITIMDYSLLKLLLGSFVGVFSYGLYSIIVKDDSFLELKDLLLSKING